MILKIIIVVRAPQIEGTLERPLILKVGRGLLKLSKFSKKVIFPEKKLPVDLDNRLFYFLGYMLGSYIFQFLNVA